MTAPQTLTTARLVIRPLRATDADALHAIYSDADLMTWWSHGPLAELSDTRLKVAGVADDPDWNAWAITLTGDDRAVGTLVAHEQRLGVAEIGYALARAHWGKGLAREGVAALVEHLFTQGKRRVFADTDPDNAASNRLLETLGFTLEGRLRGEWETHIGVRDSLIWGRLASDAAPVIASRPAPRRGRSGR